MEKSKASKIFIVNQQVVEGAYKIPFLFLGTSPHFSLPLHSFQKRVKACRTKVNHFHAVGIATASRKKTRQ
jgi:hypothetical protein